ncbi:FAD-dependent tricarballylate dehydrogenase TcuA [Nocardioides humi]|uniref:FAD-dependent tricarballylate dehydrogenase TcuA n=1 Tax=Nocardioides humi TaxID=449461 RepID=UPI001C63D144|nr:FAD-dependent tricarballylate dehydrogenase TcuA [Nocardioides humi]
MEQNKPARRVVVVGGGNAALCAAISARENGAEVIVLERAPKDLRGGNSAFTAGAMRFAYEGEEDIRELVTDLSEAELEITDFGTYPAATFLDDLARVTDYRTDPELATTLVDNSFETLKWMRDHGVRFLPIYGRQAFKVDGRFKFWGGLTLETVGGGPGLIQMLTDEADRLDIDIRYHTRAVRLRRGAQGVHGVVVVQDGAESEIECDAVVLAAGGFQSNAEWRTRYLGTGWDVAKVRGTRYNTGDGIRMALDIGASAAGNWSGAHAVQWDANAPEFGDLEVGDGFQKHSYPFGILVNADGRRFLDEGYDFRNYTYARYGREVLAQPGLRAWQVFDQKVVHLLRDEYRIKQVTKIKGDTIEELARKMVGIDEEQFVATVREYNAAVDTGTPFDPNVKDGRSTSGLEPNKSNWANTLTDGPFEAYEVTCGLTFTFGGVRVDPEAQVLDDDAAPIPGLYACGEMAAGIFYFNYPGGPA